MQIIKKKKPFDYFLYTAIILAGIVLDQLTKLLITTFMELGDSIPIIKNVLHITYWENSGAAFGMLSDRRWVFILVSTVTIIGLLIFLYLGHAQNRLYAIAISLIISGGIGNMFDRLYLGYVIDFIDFQLIDFAIFNGADSFVCIGAGLLILAMVLEVIDEAKKSKKDGKEKG